MTISRLFMKEASLKGSVVHKQRWEKFLFVICEKHDCTKILQHRPWNTSVNTDHLQMIWSFLCWHFTQHFNFYVIRVLKHLKVFCKMSFIRSFINKNCHDAIVRRNKTTSCSVSHCRSSRYEWCFSNEATLN